MLTLTKVLPALISSGSFTGSFYGTSSYSKRALTASYALNASGGSGTSGTSGATGTSGTSGNSGTSGTSGNSGTNGTSGNSGSSGTSGGGASLNTGSTYPITSSWSRKAVTASYLNIISQSLIPAKNNTYSLGTSAVRWKDIFVSTGSLYIGDVKLSTSASIVFANGLPIVVVNTASKQIEVPGLPIQLTSSYALKALTASYVSGGGSGTSGTSGTSITASLQTGSIAKQTVLYNVVSGSQNVITGLNLSGNKWGVDIKEEWDAVTVTGDQYYNSCSLLMHFNGANGSTTFTDNSPSPKTVTSNNGAAISTAQSKFGGGSGFFDGTDDYLSINYNSAFNFGTNSFTWETWIYPTNISGIDGIYATSGGSGANPKFVIHLNAGTPSIHYNNLTNGSDIYTTATSAVSINTWTHLAFVRNGSNWTWYINGNSAGSGTNNTNITFTSQPTYIGYGGESYFTPFNGYIDELRVTKGVARYTTNFTPQTSEFPNNASITQYATKYVGLIGGLNDRSVDYGVQKLSDSSLKVVKMTQTTSPFPSGSLSSSVDRVYVNVLNYTNVSVTSSYATNALTASYILGGGANGSSGTSGATGTSGTSGNSGSSGSSGTSGATGTSGTSGNNGTSGSSGANGTSGSSGATGVSGSSGTSGGGASLSTGSLYPITSSWSRRSLTASYALNASGGGSSLAVGQTFVSNGSQTVYTLSQTAANRDQILVVTNGVVQSRSGSNYTVSGTTLTLSDPVQSGGLIDVRFINAGQGSSGTSGANGANGTVQTGSVAKQTILYNVVSGSQNVITGLNLSGNKWGVDIKEEWDAVIIAGDQYYNSCSLLLHCNGANGSTTFTDNSPSPKTVTATNGAAISTAQSKFGGASGLFDGTNDYLTTTSNSSFGFGTGDYTIEAWVYPTSIRNGENLIYATDVTGGTTFGFNQTQIYIGARAVAYDLQVTYTVVTNVWTHLTVTRQSGTVRIFANGNLISSGTVTRSCPQGPGAIGDYPSLTGNGVTGYIDEIRITKGVARYITNFTPQTSEFPNNASVTQYATKYVGLIGGLNDRSVDYGVQKLSDTSLKVVKMTQTTSPFPSGSLSSSVDRVYVNVLDYNKVNVTSSYATNALTASYASNSAGGVTSGKVFAMTLLFS